MINEIRLIKSSARGSIRSAETQDIYMLLTDAAETARTIRANTDTGLPHRGDTDDDNLTCTGIEVERHDDSDGLSQVFIYTVTWATPDFDPSFTLNPLDRPPEISAEGLELEESSDHDRTVGNPLYPEGLPFRSSTGERMLGVPPLIVAGGSITITRNESGNPINNVVAYSFAANKFIWHGVAAEYARFGKITARKMFENAYTFWQVTYPIDLNRKGWRLKLLDMGLYENSSGTLKPIVDASGQPVSDAQFLDGSGGKLSLSGTPVVYPTSGYARFDPVDWAPLALPDPFI